MVEDIDLIIDIKEFPNVMIFHPNLKIINYCSIIIYLQGKYKYTILYVTKRFNY